MEPEFAMGGAAQVPADGRNPRRPAGAMSCARSRCQRRRLFGPRSLPHPQPVDHNWERSRPSSHFDPSHHRVNFTFLFFNIELLSRARRSLERHIPLSIRVGLSRNKGFLHDPSEAHQNTRVFAFLAPREETQLARARASAASAGGSAPEVGTRGRRPQQGGR